QVLRIDNGCTDLLQFGLIARELDVARAGSMAALAVNAFRKLLGKPRKHPKAAFARRERRVGVMTEQAAVIDFSPKVVMAGFVESRTHAPSPFLGIPSHGKLTQLSTRG